MNTRQFFVTGPHTDVGKTVVSAVLCAALDADYWKPVSCGGDPLDRSFVENWLKPRWKGVAHPEGLVYQTPQSPHIAAQQEGKPFAELGDIQKPSTRSPLIIEGTGGLFCPLNEKETLASLPSQWKLPVIFVARNYLGCFNHSLMTLMMLEHMGLECVGFVINGPDDLEMKSFLQKKGYRCLMHVPSFETFDESSLHLFLNTISISQLKKELCL